MLKTAIYAIMIVFLFQVIGYFTIAERILINKIISSYTILLCQDEFYSVRVNTNFALTRNQEKRLSQIFDKEITFNQFQHLDDGSIGNVFEEGRLNFTIMNKKYSFPFVVIHVGETIKGFGADDEDQYVWLLFCWIKVKNISGGIS